MSDVEEGNFSSQCITNKENKVQTDNDNMVKDKIIKSNTMTMQKDEYKVNTKDEILDDILKQKDKTKIEVTEDRENIEFQMAVEDIIEREDIKEQTVEDKDFADKLKEEVDNMKNEDREFCQHIEKLKLNIDKAGCKPQGRGIHQEGSIRFYEKVLKAKEKTLQLLREGYRPEYTCEPEEMHLKNNKSVIANMEVCRQQVRTWEQSGFVEKLKHRPRITNPLSLVTKKDLETGKMKYRTCIDPSRTLNPCLEPPTVRLQDLRLLCPR